MTMDAPSPPTNEQVGHARPNANPKSKPKRPLSAYNLFYRFKRKKIVKALAAAAGAAIDKDAIYDMIAAPPGLEGVPESATNSTLPDAVRALRRERILKDLEGDTDPRDTKTRSHRKNQNALNGAMSFVELGEVMNASWKGCDPFAKSVFNELSQAGRERYRQRVAKYNAQGQGQCEEELVEAKATPALMSANKNKPARKTLPMKKYVDAKVKSSPSPSLKGGDASASNDASTINATAEAMVQLAEGLIPLKTKGVLPTNGNEIEGSSTENETCAEAPSLSCLSSSEEVSREIAWAASNVMPQDIPAPLSAPPLNDAEELMLKIKRLELRLAEERLLARVQELEAERSRLLQAAAVAPPVLSRDSFLLNSGLPGYSGRSPSSMLQQTVSERAVVVSRIADLQSLQTLPGVPFKRPFPMMPKSAFLGSLDFELRAVKKQRLDSLSTTRRGWDF